MKITGTQKVTIEVDNRELAYALMEVILKLAGLAKDFDDAGCDWFTIANNTYIGDIDWKISTNPDVAILVKAMNILQK